MRGHYNHMGKLINVKLNGNRFENLERKLINVKLNTPQETKVTNAVSQKEKKCSKEQQKAYEYERTRRMMTLKLRCLLAR